MAKHLQVTIDDGPDPVASALTPILDELAKIAFANPQDFIRRKAGSTDADPLYERVPIDKLPRHLAAAIGSFTIDDKGRMTYSLLRKTPELLMLAKAMGLSSEKLIVQHNHAHMHMKLDLENVPTDVLENVEKLLTNSGAKVYENGEGSGKN